MAFETNCLSRHVEVVERRWLSLFGGRVSEDSRRPALLSLLDGLTITVKSGVQERIISSCLMYIVLLRTIYLQHSSPALTFRSPMHSCLISRLVVYKSRRKNVLSMKRLLSALAVLNCF
jgi:hypothetical protein